MDSKDFSQATRLSADERELLTYLLEEEGIELSQPQTIPLRRNSGELLLSFAQQRLWFLDQMEPGTPFYNIPTTRRLVGRLNVAALEQSFNEVVRRHEVLRTTFAMGVGGPVQVISPTLQLTLSVTDLSSLPESAGEAEARRLAKEEARRPFNLSREPLVRVSLLQLGDEEHVLLLNMHHIISDGWSTTVLVRELTALYEAFSAGEPSPLPELPIQYGDYAVWQRGWLQGEVLEEQLSYWRKHLAGAPALLELPTDRPRPAVQSFHGGKQRVTLSQSVTEQLKDLSQQEGVTLFTTLLAAFQTLLMRYTGQEDIVVGTGIAGRNRAEIEHLIGFFINTLALRTDLSGNPTFRELLGRIKEVTLGGYEHQDVPFEKLVEELQPERSLNRNPLFQVMFMMQNAPTQAFDLPGLKLSPLSFDTEMPVRCDLDLYLWEESSGGINGSIVYNTDLFEGGTIARMSERFEGLVESIVRDPEERLAELEVGGEREVPMMAPVVKEEVEEARAAPLSYHQERLWFIDQFETGNVYEGSPVYHNLPLIVELRGRVEEEVLEGSLNEVIARHGALRTRVVSEGGQGVQVVSPRESLKLKVVNLDDSGERVSVEGAVELGLEEAREPFELGRDLLIRATLIRVSEEEAVLAVSVHHIVADRESLGLMVGELVEVYDAQMGGRAAQLPELGLQYRDYTEWQRSLTGEELDGELFYWRWQLRGKLQALELPEDRGRPAVHTYTAARETFTLNDKLVGRLKELSEAVGEDMFTVVLAGFKALLHRYARQEEIVVGTSEACREQGVREGVVGPFANLVVLRSDLSGNPRFRELVGQMGKTVGQARAHREMPFDKLVQELKPEKDMSRTALFDVLFEMEERERPKLQMGAVEARVVETNLGYGKYDLNLLLGWGGEGLSGTMVYNADIYDRATVVQMMRHFEVLLEAVGADPERRIDEISLLSEGEENQQLEEWNATAARYPEDKTIHQLFEEQVERTPEQTAVVYGEEGLTYLEVEERANQLARHLQQKGVGPETLVALCLERSWEMVVALLAVLKAGGAYLPLDPAYPAERLTFMVEDSGVSHLITTESLLPRIGVQVFGLILLDRDGERIGAQPVTAPRARVSPDNLAYVIYTSGSTGKPKGVLLEHRNVVRLMLNERMPMSFSGEDVWTMFHSYCFDFSVWEMYGALLYGGKLVVVPEQVAKDPGLFLELLREQRVTVLNQTPSAFDSLVRQALGGDEAGQGDSELALRYVIFGGEALHPVQLQEWQRANPGTKLVNMYGITETTVHVTYKEIREQEIAENISNIGRPIPTTTTYIMDEKLGLLPVGVAGEVCVGGGGVSRGYLGREELTRAKFVTNPYKAAERLYRSGDLAKQLRNGELVYLGRIDDQVQIRGFRVELGEVRSRLLEHPGVAEAEVIARQLHTDALELVAYIVPTLEINVTALRNHLAQTLPYYMVPSAFVTMAALPLTINGKVDRRALPAPDQTRPEVKTTFVAPRTAAEEALAGIWTEVLGVERVGVYDNFFELGGHSLLATQIVSRVRAALQMEVPLRLLFEEPTVNGLVERIAEIYGGSEVIEEVARTFKKLEQLSEGEVKAMLAEQMQRAE